MTPDISIIIPVYNTKEYLPRCLSSLREQTHFNIEICLVDDGSTDGSAELCDELASRDSRIRVLHKKNEGQGLARNAGIEMASGIFLAFLDSDDYWDPDGCRRILNRLSETGADLCAFGYCKENEDGIVEAKPPIRPDCYAGERVRKEFSLHFFGDDPEVDDLRGVSACMSCFRTDIVREHGIRFASERKTLSEDTVFNLEFCKHCQKAATLPDVIYHYVMRKSSHTHRSDSGKLARTEAFCKLLRQYAGEYGLAEDSTVELRIQSTMWITIMELIRQNAQKREGKEEVCALLMMPVVQKNAKFMGRQAIGWKQKLLCAAVCRKWAMAAYWMGRLHA